MIDQSQIDRAADLIRQGRLVAFPTETVYGLGANALDAHAVARIFEAKGRPSTSPLIVHVASLEQAREFAAEWPDTATTLGSRYWPGPLTLVLRKQPCVPDVVTAGLNTVGLRVPSHPLALALIRAAGVPIAAPSANRFTELSPTTAAHVRQGLGDAVDLVLDGGPTDVGIESTVLSLVDGRALLFRPGMISQAEIERLIGPVTVACEGGEGSHPAPGMHPRHYSPRTRVLLVSPGDSAPHGRGVCLAFSGESSLPGTQAVPMPEDPREYAAVLYATLHRLDREGLDWIAVTTPPATPQWAGVLDRLRRASAGAKLR